MEHGAELNIAVTVCTVLVIGVALKVICARWRLPYTVALLVLGIATGAGLAVAPEGHPLHMWFEHFASGSQVTPDLILFAFLPLLVFESAFALEVHTLRKNVGPVLFFAGPALLVSTVAVAALMVGLTSWSWAWGWLPALIFGALISATDPVAVVALLRDLGAPKRLGVLLEGESLLNDGTAIVVFGLLLGVMTGEADATVGGTILRFVVVAGGGTLVGVGLAWAASTFMARTFNQPVVEITLTLALAYLAMVLAEGILHVSGVIAVVTAGLWMSGPGRPSISPEVHHFLHRFWEMLAYVANTLIFFLVGLVVATQIAHINARDLVIVLAAFAGIVVIRLTIFHLSRPVVARLADPIRAGEATVMGWGGLRGAVSLALALIVGQTASIPAPLRGQIFLLTAGVVLLSIVLNGTTMAALLRRLGYDRAPASERLAKLMTRAAVLDHVRDLLEKERQDPDLRAVDWAEVSQHLDEQHAALAGAMVEARAELAGLPAPARSVGYWQQVLSIERSAYWNAFAKGTLGKAAVLLLDHEIDLHADRLAHEQVRPPDARVPERHGLRARVSHALEKGRGLGRVALRYDLYRGQHLAACAVLDELSRLDVDADVAERIAETYTGYRHDATERLEDLRVNMPELTSEAETRIARRVQLNLEREVTSELAHAGAFTTEDANAAIAEIEQRMKRLHTDRSRVEVPGTADLCRHAPLFRELDDAAMDRLSGLITERLLAPNETLFEMGSRGGNVFVVARGAVAVLHETESESRLLDVLGAGDVLGEMELLTGEPRTATIRALTTVAVGEISRAGFEELLEKEPAFRAGIYQAFARRRFDNHVRGLPEYDYLGRDARVSWADRGILLELADGEEVDCSEGYLFVVTGELEGLEAPALVRPEAGIALKALGAVRALKVPALENG
jgi:Na+/H+ antiporter